jgi:alkanesulfonate monooxygenase SsuD/methylene tetrahydromethanopterin reductase-like flavin-dependent oxidoreductase (luciferase family)
MGFAFAAHFSDYLPEGPMLAYRQQFTPGVLERPQAILTVSVICADTDAEAERLAASLLVAFVRLRTGQKSVLLPPDEALAYPFTQIEATVADSIRSLHIVGSPATVRRRIEDLVARTQADEVMITTFTYSLAARLHSYELVAAAFDLTPLTQASHETSPA